MAWVRIVRTDCERAIAVVHEYGQATSVTRDSQIVMAVSVHVPWRNPNRFGARCVQIFPAKDAVAGVESHADEVAGLVHDGQIELAVAVNVYERHRTWIRLDGVAH